MKTIEVNFLMEVEDNAVEEDEDITDSESYDDESEDEDYE